MYVWCKIRSLQIKIWRCNATVCTAKKTLEQILENNFALRKMKSTMLHIKKLIISAMCTLCPKALQFTHAIYPCNQNSIGKGRKGKQIKFLTSSSSSGARPESVFVSHSHAMADRPVTLAGAKSGWSLWAFLWGSEQSTSDTIFPLCSFFLGRCEQSTWDIKHAALILFSSSFSRSLPLLRSLTGIRQK